MSALISVPHLCEQIASKQCVVLDVRHHLLDHDKGQDLYEQGHLPGAHFVPVESVLTGTKSAHSGRHPLPEREAFIRYLISLGITPKTPIVVYDADTSMFAARLWWMLRWAGCQQVQVLDGGYAAWVRAGQAIQKGNGEQGAAVNVADASESALDAWPKMPGMPTVDLDFMRAHHQDADYTLIDARSADRFAGQNETIDPVGGHIPGAHNMPFAAQLQPDGRFLEPQALRALWAEFFQKHAPDRIICSCGSGVTACHLLLGLHEAGYAQAALYPGSWSQWCSYPDAPVET